MRTNAGNLTCDAFARAVAIAEGNVLQSLDVERSLARHFEDKGTLKWFAQAFYFIRVHFVKLNFVVGARCPTHELYWAGLAHNLMEELGGNSGPSHNELYRWFLQDVGLPNEAALERPAFATRFDRKWDQFAQRAPLEEALGAIAVYEIFDNPDYQMLLNIMTRAGVTERGLLFFKVHAAAEHFELFEDYFRHVSQQPSGINTLERATAFVLDTQKEMWSGLLEHLTANK